MGKKQTTALRVLAVLLSLSVMPGCATTQSKSAQSPLRLIEQYLAALNRRDLLVLTAYVTPDVEWYSLLNGKYLQEVAGREALATTLQTYYAQNPQTHWTIEESMLVQQKVVVRERSAWRAAEGHDERAGERVSLVVYELRDGRIARISYFLDSP